LAVLAEYSGQEVPASLMLERIPHLAVRASEAIGVVGPLVEPGRSACLRCIDLAKTERDPAWPLILAQLAAAQRQPQAQPQACDTVLAATVAAAAAGRALACIDRAAPDPAVTNATLEFVLPDWEWRRRSWQPHPACTCHGLL
jgi:bacteriocin biosynthesis cyclodehydratase domain-containing protein